MLIKESTIYGFNRESRNKFFDNFNTIDSMGVLDESEYCSYAPAMVPIVESAFGNIIKIEDIISFSESNGIDDIGYSVKIICEDSYVDPNTITFAIQEENFIADENLQTIVEDMRDYNIPVLTIPISDNNPVAMLTNVAINSFLESGNTAVLAMLADDPMMLASLYCINEAIDLSHPGRQSNSSYAPNVDDAKAAYENAVKIIKDKTSKGEYVSDQMRAAVKKAKQRYQDAVNRTNGAGTGNSDLDSILFDKTESEQREEITKHLKSKGFTDKEIKHYLANVKSTGELDTTQIDLNTLRRPGQRAPEWNRTNSVVIDTAKSKLKPGKIATNMSPQELQDPNNYDSVKYTTTQSAPGGFNKNNAVMWLKAHRQNIQGTELAANNLKKIGLGKYVTQSGNNYTIDYDKLYSDYGIEGMDSASAIKEYDDEGEVGTYNRQSNDHNALYISKRDELNDAVRKQLGITQEPGKTANEKGEVPNAAPTDANSANNMIKDIKNKVEKGGSRQFIADCIAKVNSWIRSLRDKIGAGGKDSGYIKKILDTLVSFADYLTRKLHSFVNKGGDTLGDYAYKGK